MIVEAPEEMPVVAVEEEVRSKDGTRIGFVRFGSGPAIVFVHGSLSTHGDWFQVAKSLASQFTCILMDRRGHGLSSDGSAVYSIEHEYDDIATVLEVAGTGTSLVAHSFGATCALGGAMRAPVAKMVLYEPPLSVGGPVAGKALDDYCRAVNAERLEEALEIGMKEFVGLPPAQIAAMRRSSIWPKLAALVPTWPRELEEMDGLGRNVDGYSRIASPTLLLVGSESAHHPFKDSIAALARILPHVQVATLQGQSHMALRLAPQAVTQQIASFLSQ